ncbi:MAG: hypothetical protein JNJ83_02325 [Verrucomicrobiaceae bacterium]|nr:hypothetical protein [Verrucomicrobiaceae bacterium]
MKPPTLFFALTTTLAFSEPCRIEVTDRENGWPVPLVELRTTNNQRFVTDNAGIIAFDDPDSMGRLTWFDLIGHGYEVKKDGFGMAGVKLTPEPGKTLTLQVTRSLPGKRLGRLTGSGLFSESKKLGLHLDVKDSGLMGSDSVQNAVYQGKLFWAWGDTNMPGYPLGIFHMTSATTPLKPLRSFEPPLKLQLDYFTDDKGAPRGVAKMPGEGPTWVSGYVALPDKTGKERLVGMYVKVKGFLDVYEAGLCVWDEQKLEFEHLLTHWKKSPSAPNKPLMPDGHPVIHDGWVWFGNPLPEMRCKATFEAWQDPSQWEPVTKQAEIDDITPHSGSVAWNAWRKKWVTIFLQHSKKPGQLGEIWYAESPQLTGPWANAIKVVTHDNYTFYNPRIHPELTAPDSPLLLFEGTYTILFANKPAPTPRYEYNQILYRLDLDQMLK